MDRGCEVLPFVTKRAEKTIRVHYVGSEGNLAVAMGPW